MAIADSIGHNFEFLPARDRAPTAASTAASTDSSTPFFEYPRRDHPGGRVHNAHNVFQLKPGQWTDDTSMGLCLADSMTSNAVSGEYDGTRARVWYWSWWHNGLNNAFRLDKSRANHFGGASLSVGLGGNVSKSLAQTGRLASMGQPSPPHFDLRIDKAHGLAVNGDGEDAGNGSLMRLAPIPLRYHTDIERARLEAYESSLSTHPGPMVAEACSFMAHLVVRAIHRDGHQTAAAFLDEVCSEYVDHLSRQDCRGGVCICICGGCSGIAPPTTLFS
jgi:ADP-ribosylglycohydrolase